MAAKGVTTNTLTSMPIVMVIEAVFPTISFSLLLKGMSLYFMGYCPNFLKPTAAAGMVNGSWSSQMLIGCGFMLDELLLALSCK